MKGLCKFYGTVILNGSEEMVRNVATAIDIETNERYGKATIQTLDDASVTTITSKTTRKTFEKIRGMIEQAYPNQCAFVQNF